MRQHRLRGSTSGNNHERAVSEGSANTLGLGGLRRENTCLSGNETRLQLPRTAENARAARREEGHHDKVTDPDVTNVRPDLNDLTNTLVPRQGPGCAFVLTTESPQVAAAHARRSNVDDGVARITNDGLIHRHARHIERSVESKGTH
jgi:hypothetical protein